MIHKNPRSGFYAIPSGSQWNKRLMERRQQVWLLRNIITISYITRLPNRGLWKGEVEWVGQLAFSVTLLSDFRASALAHWSSRSLRLRVIKIFAVVFTLYPPKIPKTKLWRTAKKKGSSSLWTCWADLTIALHYIWMHENMSDDS